MRVRLTPEQAKNMKLEQNMLFIRAAFYTGHSVQYILEYITPRAYDKERHDLIELAYELGMTDDDVVEVLP